MKTLTIQTTNARARMCVGKQAYFNESEAITRASACLRRRPDLILRAYKCPICNWFHLTKLPPKNNQQRKSQ
jgi:hypothetical protein